MHEVCVSIDPRFSNAQESTLLVEGSQGEWDEAAVSAGEAGRLQITSILGRLPLVPAGDHSCGAERQQEGALPLGKCDEDGRPGTGSRLYYISSSGLLTTPRSQ